MFYRTEDPHGLKHNPFNAIVVPRPIGWISTVDRDGRANLAPYSFFNAVAYTPPQVMFSATGPHMTSPGNKDTLSNIEITGEFVVNMATVAHAEAVNITSAPAPSEIDEFALAGLEKEASTIVSPPRIAGCPVHLECIHTKTVTLPSVDPDAPPHVVFGQVVGIHIADEVIVDGMVRYDLMKPLSRLGYMDFGTIGEVITMQRPGWPIKT